MSSKLKASEQQLNQINQYALQSVYLVTEGKTLDDALINNEKLVTKIEKLQDKNIVKNTRVFLLSSFQTLYKK